MGVLTACGPTAPTEEAPSSETLPFNAQDVIQRAHDRMAPSIDATPSSAVISSEIAVPSIMGGTQGQSQPAIAAGNGVYLVAWKEAYPTSYAVLATRVRASDGVVLDSTPIVIEGNPYLVGDPAIAFDGNNFLVVYTYYKQSNIHASTIIEGRRIRASDGALLDSYPFRISYSETTSQDQEKPSVAFTGTNYLVVWHGYATGNGSTLGVYGALVNTSGAVLDYYSVPITLNGRDPKVACNSSLCLAVWSDTANTIKGVRINPATWGIDSTPIAIAGYPWTAYAPDVATDGTNFLVIWNDSTNRLVLANRVRAADGAVLDLAGKTVTGGVKSPASIHFDGTDYRIVLEAGRGTDWAIGERVKTDGTVLSGELFLSELAQYSSLERPAIATLGTGLLLTAYAQYTPPPFGGNRIRLRQVSDIPFAAQCPALPPTITLNGAAETTLECTSGGTYTDPGAKAFDGCGNPLEVHSYNSGHDSSGPGPNAGAEGSYTVTYAAWDSQGRTVNASRTVNVDDRAAPTLSLKGDAHMTHTCGSQWVDPGVDAVDACYGNLGLAVWHEGEVNGWAEGTYTVTYSLTDGGGNSATPVTRTVDVVDCPW